MSLDQRLINVLLSQHWWWVANGESRVEGGRDVINIYLDNGQHLAGLGGTMETIWSVQQLCYDSQIGDNPS